MKLSELYFANYLNAPSVTSNVSGKQNTASAITEGKSFRDSIRETGYEKPVEKTEYTPKENSVEREQKTDTKEPKKIDKPDKTDEKSKNETISEKTNDKETTETNKEDTAPAEETAATEQTSEKPAKGEETLTEEEKAVAEQIAAALGVTPEEVAAVLLSLGIKPQELKQPEKLTEFMQKITGAQSPAMLLTMPNMKEAFKAVKQIVENFNPEQTEGQQVNVAEQSTPITDNTGKQQPRNSENANDDSANITPTTETQTAVADSAEVSFAKVAEGQGIQASAVQAAKTASQAQVIKPEDAAALLKENNAAVNAGTAVSGTDSPQTVQTSAVKAESMRNINTQDVINQIVDKMKIEVKADVTTEIKITLRPEHLGDVTMKIVTENGIVTAMFLAENERVKAMIEAGFNELQQSLQDAGVNINQLSVSVGQDSGTNRQSDAEGNNSFGYGGGQEEVTFAEETQTEKVKSDGDNSVDYKI
ncbi:MAG: flagellar hook-length control protein FliK [Clostridiales bacterium]|nr:flagellar hook-length control protein FliK [Clostridiales bacterium]